MQPVTTFASTNNVLSSLPNICTDNDSSIQARFCGCNIPWSLLEVSKFILQRQGQAKLQAHFCLSHYALFVHHCCHGNLGPEVQRKKWKSTPQQMRMSPSRFLLGWKEALLWSGKVSWYIAMEVKAREGFGLTQGYLIPLGIDFT